MSLILFLIGIAVYYYLYLSYFSKRRKPSQGNENITEIDSVGCLLSPRQQIGSVFQNFILKMIDPANNNYLYAANKKPHPFTFRAFVDR